MSHHTFRVQTFQFGIIPINVYQKQLVMVIMGVNCEFLFNSVCTRFMFYWWRIAQSLSGNECHELVTKNKKKYIDTASIRTHNIHPLFFFFLALFCFSAKKLCLEVKKRERNLKLHIHNYHHTVIKICELPKRVWKHWDFKSARI